MITEPKTISIELPAKYWVIILSLLNRFISTKAAKEVERLNKEGKSPEDLSDTEQALIAGPIVAQGIIIKALTEAGVMTPEANKQLGIDSMMEFFKENEKG